MRRFSFVSKTLSLVGAAAALPALFACLDHPLKRVEYKNEQQHSDNIPIALNKDVDILFVIDNSGSMVEEQANLAAQFGKFIEKLEGVDANYRIGITTTDHGNPSSFCRNTGPESGEIALKNCSDHPAEFSISQGENAGDYHDVGCLAACKHDDIEILETATELDSAERVRPWIESFDGVTNIGGGLSTTEAFQCFGPQGIVGCGFESPLEAMSKALTRFGLEDQEAHGFLRPNAMLAVVFVTDEADCSYNPKFGEVFTTYNEHFWSIEQNETSAICWNAGVECTGEGGVYEDCRAVDKDINGNIIEDPARAREEAVLVPVQRYIDELQRIEDDKRRRLGDGTHEVFVAAITGVPVGYHASDAQIPYRDADDATEQENFGIGAGCSDPSTGNAVPPVRMRTFAEHFAVSDKRNLYSVCEDDYGPALADIAEVIGRQLKPACMPKCVRDTQLEAGLQPECELRESTRTSSGEDVERTLVECIDYETIPEGEDSCYRLRDDKDERTETLLDDLDEACEENGSNLQFEVIRRDGKSAPPGTTVTASCLLSVDCESDCPELASCGG